MTIIRKTALFAAVVAALTAASLSPGYAWADCSGSYEVDSYDYYSVCDEYEEPVYEDYGEAADEEEDD